MGLAEPRKRIKLSHDPRNTSWTNSSDSFGQKMMQQQGWKAGEALGANGRGSKFSDAEAAKVNVKYKDDMLGLGASLKSKDIASQRTGFDAFQGLLGRLNAKSEEEVQVVEKKLEDKKLAMFAQGRWGGMLFVPGGLLVQSDPYKQVEAMKEAQRQQEAQSRATEEPVKTSDATDTNETSDEATEKAKRRAARKQRKEAKLLRKEEKRRNKEAKLSNSEGGSSLPTPDSSSANDGSASESQVKAEKRNKRPRSAEPVPKPNTTVKSAAVVKTGRQLLRGKNIQAKRMAFSDMKGLDEIFMRAG